MTDTVYILLFRGVGGATQLPTKPLREALTEAGFDKAGTYINSGNAYLRTRMSRAAMLKRVAGICAEKFAFTKEIYAPTLSEWKTLVEQNPFDGKFAAGNHLHAAWLAEKPQPENIEALRSLCSGGEAIEVVDTIAYLHTPGGFGTSKFAASFDKKIGVANTARNWNTVLKLFDLAEAAAR